VHIRDFIQAELKSPVLIEEQNDGLTRGPHGRASLGYGLERDAAVFDDDFEVDLFAGVFLL
jgi:hypothetical protein